MASLGGLALRARRQPPYSLEELFEIADRIAVMYEGRILDVIPAAEARVARVGLIMAGAAR